ncbi:MAG: PilZ domain-containing protein [Pseudomonadota bacterium]
MADRRREKREFVRALISTNAKIARIDPKHLDKLRAPDDAIARGNSEYVPGTETGLPQWANQFAECLQRIDNKLDRILEKLECEHTEVSPADDATIRDISGSGLGLVLSEPIETGQLLQISMSLPGFPLNSFQAFGRVVRVSPRKGNNDGLFDVAVKFLNMSESDREQLIAYSFSAQRKAIRSVSGITSD